MWMARAIADSRELRSHGPAEGISDFDVIVVGAGISGIDVAYRLRERNPRMRYVVLEARAAIGGTWDLFRYPGVRSDSDIVTLGFPFRPYRGEKSIVDGDTIAATSERPHGTTASTRTSGTVTASLRLIGRARTSAGP
jgi:flavin-dependent dehydrogenase